MRWTEEELKLALALYCQLPYGKLHHGNPEIIDLANRLGRTPSSVAMKLVNFASLDPAITSSGRKGLDNASALDRKVWEEFGMDWDGELSSAADKLDIKVPEDWSPPEVPVETTRRAEVEVRTKQYVFRRMMLAGYSSRCCMSGLSIERCLVASHIMDWKVKEEARLNPHNGLCLSALHDKAFEYGYLTVTPDYVIRISEQLRAMRNDELATGTLAALEGRKIALPEKFHPGREFLEWHVEKKFERFGCAS